MTRRLYVADLHLEPDDALRLDAFGGLLEGPGAAADEIFLLGDVCEMWIGDDDDGDLAHALAAHLCRAGRSADVYFMPGNRDFLLGAGFAARAGLRLLGDAHRLDDGTLLVHGDTLCTDDAAYQSMRRVLRSPEWRDETLASL